MDLGVGFIRIPATFLCVTIRVGKDGVGIRNVVADVQGDGICTYSKYRNQRQERLRVCL